MRFDFLQSEFGGFDRKKQWPVCRDAASKFEEETAPKNCAIRRQIASLCHGWHSLETLRQTTGV